jgi:ABC-type transport system substrate-binding protein
MLKQQSGVHIDLADPAGYMGVIRFNELWPPFNNPLMRQAVLHTVDQQEYVRTVTGGDPSAFIVCHSFFPCGTPYGTPPTADPMAKPDWVLAHKLVGQAGYKGEKIVLLNPPTFQRSSRSEKSPTPISRSLASMSISWKPTGIQSCSGARARRRSTRAAGTSFIPGGPVRRS